MDIILRASILYVFLLVILRGLGGRSIGEMSPIELVVLLSMGDLIAQGALQEDFSLTGAFLAVGTMACWSVALSYLGYRSNTAARILEGAPIVVLRDGKPDLEVLKRRRIMIEELKSGAREHGIADLSDVEVGIFEPNGDFTFIQKDR